jgi:hypothetical protein
MLVSTNKGQTWTLMSNFPAISWASDANSGSRTYQKKMAVDPNNADIVYIGTPANGLYATINGTSGASATFTRVSAIPSTASTRNGITAIAFDPASSVVNGATQHIMCCSYGNDVYETTNGGSSWSAAGSGGPVNVCDAVFSQGIYFAAQTGKDLLGYSNSDSAGSGTWHDLGSGSFMPNAVTISPWDSTWIFVWGNTGAFPNSGLLSISGGVPSVTWYGPNFYNGGNPNVPPSDTGWLAETQPGYSSSYPTANNMVGSGCFFDPTVNPSSTGYARIWGAWGYGVSHLDLTGKTENGNFAWANWSIGIENMVAVQIASAPGYDLVVAVEDQQIFQIASLSTPPPSSTPQLGARNHNNSAWSLDWSQSDPGLVVALSSGYYVGNYNYTSFSGDGGTTWTTFSPTPFSSDGGDITCAGSGQFCAITVGTSVTPVYWTGSAWAASSGAPAAGYVTSKWNNSKVLANESAGGMYLIVPNGGTYKSTNGGQTWSKIDSTVVFRSTFICKLLAVPGKAQSLFFTSGFDQGQSYPGNSFYMRTSDARIWAAVPNVKSVFTFGFGQVYPGYTYPTLWLIGFVNKRGAGYKWGLWRSRDLGVSDWTWITDWPGGHIDMPRCMSGDMNDYKKVYIGYSGSSFMYGTGIV